ncbi:MAG: hypothetical protein KF689_00345 [Gemmatimonadaceae bacterium]|nr:hypothetical protein [Gemmatimonadaceae bacterium]MCW5826376.1 hypothetical protein [Gemmatimonadaceae bacterium]
MLIFDGLRFTAWRDGHTGSLAIVAEHVATTVAALALVLTWIAVGRAVRDRLERSRGEGTLDLSGAVILDAVVGAGLLALALLAVGAIGLLTNAAALGVAGAALVVVRRAAWRSAEEIGRALLRAPRWSVAAGLAVLVAALVPALTPPAEWDSLAYHLRIPLGILERGDFAVPSDSRGYATQIGVAHLATLPLLAAGLMEGPSVVHVLLLPVLIAGTASLARALGGVASRYIVAAVLIGSPALVLVAWTARIDLFLAVAALGAHRALTYALDGADEGPVYLAALAIGTAFGVKSLGAAYIVALLPLLLLPAALPWPLRARGAMLAFVACVPWMAKSWMIAGTPLYPLWYWGALEPWLEQLATAAELTGPIDRSALSSLARAREPFALLAAFFAPERLTIEVEGVWYRLSPLLFALPVALLVPGRRVRVVVHAAVPLVFVALVVLPATAINLRYLLPAYPVLAALTAVGIGALVQFAPRLHRAIVATGCIVALLPALHMVQARGTRFAWQARHAVGAVDAELLLARNSALRSLDRVGDQLAASGASDGTVLLLWEAQALMLPQPAIIDAFHANWPLLAQLAAVEHCLTGSGIRWVVVGWSSLTFFQSKGISDETLRLAEFERFRARCLGDPVYARDGYLAFALRAAAAP